MVLKAVVRQNRVEPSTWFIPDQEVYLHLYRPIVLGGLVEVRVQRYYITAVVVGMGWEGDEFVLNVL